jgi:altronate hydrolase
MADLLRDIAQCEQDAPGGFPVPTLKLSSNSALAARKPAWIDFDAGTCLDPLRATDATYDLLTLMMQVASGSECRAEKAGIREIAIWKRGVTL